MDIVRTRIGLRLSQHGVVISELRISPGPTHSVFDLLAAMIAVFAPEGRVGILGFAAGGLMAPLAALHFHNVLDAVDLDQAAFNMFSAHCPEWASQIRWNYSDAVLWLRRQRQPFRMILDDLSVPKDGSVFKPDASWSELPGLIHNRLERDGVAIFNLLLPLGASWPERFARIVHHYPNVCVIALAGFENRFVIAGRNLPDARALGSILRRSLRAMGSRQARELRTSTLRRAPGT